MKKISFSSIFSLFIVTVFLFSQRCLAATATNTFTVTATVGASCTVSASNVTFTNYNPVTGANNTANGTSTTTCTNGAPYTLQLSTGSSGSYTSRTMTGTASSSITYNLFTDSSYNNIWGDGTTGGSKLNPNTGSFTGNGAAQNNTIYGEITPAIQNTVGAGTYSDTITIQVNF